MQSNTLKAKTKRKKSQQVGRGGTRGKTSGRGTKGQNARAGRKKRPELRDFIKRFPKLRGRGVSSFKSREVKPLAVNLSLIEKHFAAGETVSLNTLVAKKVVSIKKSAVSTVKILGTGDITKKMVFEGVEVSASAKTKIEKAGGTIK
jgi:large subunit ribosomal protein L15